MRDLTVVRGPALCRCRRASEMVRGVMLGQTHNILVLVDFGQVMD